MEPFVGSTYPGTRVGGNPASRLVALPYDEFHTHRGHDREPPYTPGPNRRDGAR